MPLTVLSIKPCVKRVLAMIQPGNKLLEQSLKVHALRPVLDSHEPHTELHL
jgi:hypothetical protein